MARDFVTRLDEGCGDLVADRHYHGGENQGYTGGDKPVFNSTFATVRLRTVKTKGCLSRKTALAMAFKLILSAKQKWRKLDGSNQLAELIEGVPFKDGIKITKHAA